MVTITEEFIYSIGQTRNGTHQEISAIKKRDEKGDTMISVRMRWERYGRGSKQKTITINENDARGLASAIEAAIAS